MQICFAGFVVVKNNAVAECNKSRIKARWDLVGANRWFALLDRTRRRPADMPPGRRRYEGIGRPSGSPLPQA
jgi:hypothetical protein